MSLLCKAFFEILQESVAGKNENAGDERADVFDWSAPVTKQVEEELDLRLSDSEETEEEAEVEDVAKNENVRKDISKDLKEVCFVP